MSNLKITINGNFHKTQTKIQEQMVNEDEENDLNREE